jgi:hypothetical protein
MTTYTYTFGPEWEKADSLNGFSDVVTAVHWTLTATDGDKSVSLPVTNDGGTTWYAFVGGQNF